MEEALSPERLLIVRLTAVGDVIHGAPVLCALRDRFPDAFIAWAVEGRGGDLLEGHRALNKLIRLPRRWYRSPRAVMALRRELLAHRFDTTIDLQCLTKSAAVARLSGAPRRIGAGGASGRELSKRLNNVLTEVVADHVVHHYLRIAQPLGVDVVGEDNRPKGFERVRFDLEERDHDAAFAGKTLGAAELSSGAFAILNPGAGWKSKLWPPERYGQLARQLASEHRLRTLAVWGGDDERPLAESIVNHSSGAATLAPPTTLPQLGAICRRARLFVGSDTGPMHLAVAVGTPTVSLHGPSDAAWCGAYGQGNATVQKQQVEGSYGDRRRASDAAMRAISVNDVAAACRRVLAPRSIAAA
ncbi:MAG: glycosyltransferase family 9 protein [Planctomycetota bacterium]